MGVLANDLTGGIEVRIETMLKWPLVLAKNIKGSCYVRFKQGGKVFAVWQVVKSDEIATVFKGSYMDSDTSEEITVSNELKVRMYALIRECHDEYSHSLSIQPVGFWTDVINVRKNTDMWYDNGTQCKWAKAEISWGSGGTSGQFTDIEEVDLFVEALQYAKEWAKEIDKRYK
jgi:hypothetical protein